MNRPNASSATAKRRRSAGFRLISLKTTWPSSGQMSPTPSRMPRRPAFSKPGAAAKTAPSSMCRRWARVNDEAGEMLGIMYAVADITERKKLEGHLRQAQKMEAVGNLTGGMAHDFNNLLGVIIGNLDLLRDAPSGDPEADEYIGEALAAALRGADLTRRLLAFSRRQPLQPARIDVNELIGGIVKLLERTLGEEIQIT